MNSLASLLMDMSWGTSAEHVLTAFLNNESHVVINKYTDVKNWATLSNSVVALNQATVFSSGLTDILRYKVYELSSQVDIFLIYCIMISWYHYFAIHEKIGSLKGEIVVPLEMKAHIFVNGVCLNQVFCPNCSPSN